MDNQILDDELLADYLTDIKDADMFLNVPLPEDINLDPIPLVCTKKEPEKKPKRKQKDEIAYLRNRVEEMENKLLELRQTKSTKRVINTPWENEARSQSVKRQKSEEENLVLKKSLEQQVAFAKQLQAVLTQSPNISLFPFDHNEKWKLYHLVSDRAKRIEAMHAMADRDYENLSSILLETSLGALNSEFHGMRINDGNVISLDSNEASVAQTSFQSGLGTGLEIEVLRHYTCPEIPFQTLAETYWSVFGGQGAAELTRLQLIEKIDDNLMYVQLLEPNPVTIGGPMKQTNLVMKRYRERNRHVILWRGVLDDELYPLRAGYIRAADNGWFILEDRTPMGSDQPKNDVKFVVKIRPPVSTTDHLPGVIIETMVGSFLQNAAAIRNVVEDGLLLKAREDDFVEVLNEMLK